MRNLLPTLREQNYPAYATLLLMDLILQLSVMYLFLIAVVAISASLM
jgi:hypothetical protein